MPEGSIHRRGTEDAEFPDGDLTQRVLAAAFEVHSVLGAGLLESVYQHALEYELTLHGVPFAAQTSIPVIYKGQPISAGLRLDLLVDDAVIVEVKAVERLEPVHQAQLLTYLRIAGKRTGLLVNFNVPHLRQGIRRVVNTPRNSASSIPLR
jgi:GxxExxY protein